MVLPCFAKLFRSLRLCGHGLKDKCWNSPEIPLGPCLTPFLSIFSPSSFPQELCFLPSGAHLKDCTFSRVTALVSSCFPGRSSGH